MPRFYSSTGNAELWSEKPEGYFTQEEWAELHPDPVVEVSLEDLKAAKKAEIANARYKAEIAGISFNGTVVMTDRESQALITGAALAAIRDSSYTVRWKTSDGFVPLNAAQVIEIAQMVRDHVQGCFDREAVYDESIDGCATADEINAIQWV